jgi:antitoxin component YwqK of YwqJK toxin-antitoxin module
MRFFFAVIIFQFIVVSGQSQLFNRQFNQFGEDGFKTGKWISYWDENEKIPMSKAKYKQGREVGVSKEYHINGRIRLKFRYDKDRIRVKYFSESRKLEQKGWARMDYTAEDIHFYWHGSWKFYDADRKLIRKSHYQFGEEIISTID